MIVRILAKSKTFKGVLYNTNKVDKNKGELMKVSGFGALQGMTKLSPLDYIDYLQMLSARSKRIEYPQFHAFISAKGKTVSKQQLTVIATAWLEKMGYGQQPYLIIFHKDTRNHHVHIVSTRVDKSSGEKIYSKYERIRGITALNQVMNLDEKLVSKADLEKALAFNFSTKAQLMMVLESKGYKVLEDQGKLVMVKFGLRLCEINASAVEVRTMNYRPDVGRAKQIRAWLQEYRLLYSGVLRGQTVPLPGGRVKQQARYTSDLAVVLKEKFGMELIFQGNPGKAPYDYTLLDGVQGNVFKGNELLDLSVLTEELGIALQRPIPPRSDWTANIPNQEQMDELLPLALDCALHSEQAFTPYEAPIGLSIADDIDDEAIHGRKRQKRNNTR
ncbi:relaxase/mobilization nuclease domain-containing protein [Pedobacter foliorum]|uniref:relaxase/mobilization nuclease domain-containing protein n=1 Tax=Pedobacter foliorum TaxID=2739058 RepID=UPI001564EC8A|nr:relaxase/mobilization nuclease domain-containing protein [Pedobacter foliorum]NRF37562.1 relaxase/mobilization nuclease domain-containing protein [Pedobacter foliorum]